MKDAQNVEKTGLACLSPAVVVNVIQIINVFTIAPKGRNMTRRLGNAKRSNVPTVLIWIRIQKSASLARKIVPGA